jgi:CzcA family heavy metal efflux pump
MLNHVIALSLRNRGVVLVAALVVSLAGAYVLPRMPVDVFPDLNRPTVTVMTETPGLAPEEVETLVTRPIELAMMGATGVRRVRSASEVGLSIVWVEFDWNSDVARIRQMATEKLQSIRERLPKDANPVLAPVSSIMGEVLLVGLWTPDGTSGAMEMRTFAEFTLRNRLLQVPGVSQVTVLGGAVKQLQIVTSPARLAAHDVTLRQLTEAAEKANAVAGGGEMVRDARSSMIRIAGRAANARDIEKTPVAWREPRPVLIGDVADVRIGGADPIGAGAVRIREDGVSRGGPAVIVAIQKQPGVDTRTLDGQLDAVLSGIALPSGVRLERLFRQADFIRTAVDNVVHAIRDGAIWVFVVLFLFLWNFRTSLITLAAIPLSVLTTALVFAGLGLTIDTMTLGGIAIAIGTLVDDAIVDVENVLRRLRENRLKPTPEAPLAVVLRASTEIRGSIVYATLIVCVVVLPLFALPGIEGRMFGPLGLAYVVSLLASLAVSLTVTPVLASLLLPTARFLDRRDDPLLLRWLKRIDAPVVRFAVRHPWPILAATLALGIASKGVVFWMGAEFLPPFSEGTLTINVQTEPGTSLAESERIAGRVEAELLRVPEIVSIGRRTGRAEMDEHAEGVHSSEIDVRLDEHGRPREAVLADVRERIGNLPGVQVDVGQPIAHRLDHLLSGVRAQVAVKIFGPDLDELRSAAADVGSRMSAIAGIVDLRVEPQTETSQVRIEVDRAAAARHGLAAGDVVSMLETAYKGRVVSEIVDGDRRFELVVRFDEASRRDPVELGRTIVDAPSGRKVALADIAKVLDTVGPTTILHEEGQRRIVVSCNVQGRDLASVVADIRAAVEPIERRLHDISGDYRIALAGQFEAQQEAMARLAVLGSIAVVGVFLLLWKCLGSWVAAAQVLFVNVPLAAIGAVAILMLVNRPTSAALTAAPWFDWPRVWAQATTLSLAHWIGFITLVGIVSRNGILMISHYIHLMEHEGAQFDEAMIVRGSLERLAPVLMTACVAAIGLLPLALGAGQKGTELLHPLALVVIGGLIDSTLLDQLVTPAVFFLCGRLFGPGIYRSHKLPACELLVGGSI